MGFPLNHIYKFNKNNKNYIQAIVNYNKAIRITGINGVNISERNFKGSDLQKIIDANMKDFPNEMCITCRSWTDSSTFQLFPEAKEVVPSPVKTEDPEVKKQIDMTLKYFNKIMAPISQPRHDVFYHPPTPKFSDANQVAALLTQLNENYNQKIRTLHIKSEQAFLIQHEDQTFILFYGYDDIKGETLGQLHLSFDIEKGFINTVGNTPSSIISFLDEVVTLWKKNNYTGDMFAEKNLELAAQRQEKILLWREHNFEVSFFPTGLIDLADLKDQINNINKLAKDWEKQIDKIETYAKKELESLPPSEKNDESLQALINADKDYQYCKKWLAQVPECLKRLECSLLFFPSANITTPSNNATSSSATISSLLHVTANTPTNNDSPAPQPKSVSDAQYQALRKIDRARQEAAAQRAISNQEDTSCHCVIC
ncbi:MAG: hypothetical protein P4M12_12160 [Gammaproteobacteria bacterium]|nr:hypothetical protein [Gammaproteobacteria bacterium]